MARREKHKSFKNQVLTPLYKAVVAVEFKVRDWDLSERFFKVGEEYEAILETACADGIHVRLRTPGLTAPTWIHKRYLAVKPLAESVVVTPPTPTTTQKQRTVRVLYRSSSSKQ